MSQPPGKYDVAIVGAGPAGSSCAIRLVKKGLKVLLVERKKFPRAKLCGEFISPECLGHFEELGVLDQMYISGGVAIARTVFYARSGRSVTVPCEWFAEGSHAIGLSRALMDQVLLARASAAGAEVLEEVTATKLITSSDGYVKGLSLRDNSGSSFEINADLIIDATGHARVLSRLANPAEKKRRADFVAFKTHLSGALVPDSDCEIYGYSGGYGGSSRIEGGLNDLCFIIDAATAKRHGSDAERVLRKVLFTNRQAKKSLSEALIVDQWLAVPIENYGRSELSPAPGLLSIGDAAGFIDPFTGSGILLALQSSRIVTEVIENLGCLDFAALLSEYKIRYRSAFDRRLGVSSLVRRVAFVPFFAEIVVGCLSLSKRLTRYLATATRQPATTNIAEQRPRL